MRIGKLGNEELQKIVLSKISVLRDDVVLRPGIGLDCGAIKMDGDDICVLSTDPITGASSNVGRLAVHVSCNDAAAAGAEPVGLLLCILAPQDATLDEIQSVIEQAGETAASINVEIIGGHTEVTDSVNRMIAVSTVIGRTRSGKLISAAGASQGDALLITKHIAMEGTSIIASDYPERLKGALNEDELEFAKGLSERLSVVKEGMIARDLDVTAMHDVTEGGVFGAVWEMCRASGMGAEVETESIPVLDVTRKICSVLGLNPFRLISSGSMLIATPEPDLVMERLSAGGVEVAKIGVFQKGGIIARHAGRPVAIGAPGRDELFRL